MTSSVPSRTPPVPRRAAPRFYFSLRSPYSWLAHQRLTAHHPDVAAAVEWRPFFEPDQESAALLREAGGHFPYTDMSRAKHVYILQDVRRCAREAGLTPVWPVDREPVWEVPHLAYLVAADEGRGREFVRRLYELRWEEGRDICDRAVVAEAAAGLGLPADRLATAADEPVLRARGLDALLDIDKDGVFGVPFFVHGRDKFWGLDRLDAFVTSVLGSRVHVPPPAPQPPPHRIPHPLPVLGADGDQGHAGGCG